MICLGLATRAAFNSRRKQQWINEKAANAERKRLGASRFVDLFGHKPIKKQDLKPKVFF